jgi:hypothetical protein
MRSIPYCVEDERRADICSNTIGLGTMRMRSILKNEKQLTTTPQYTEGLGLLY